MSQIATISNHFSHRCPHCDSRCRHPTSRGHHTTQAEQHGPEIQSLCATLHLPSPGGLGSVGRCVCFNFSVFPFQPKSSIPTSPSSKTKPFHSKHSQASKQPGNHPADSQGPAPLGRQPRRMQHKLNTMENNRRRSTVAKTPPGYLPIPTSILPS